MDGEESTAIDTERAREYVDAIEELYEELASEQGEFMAKAKAIRERIKDQIKAAVDDGIDRAALKGIVKDRMLDVKKAKIRAGLEERAAAQFKQMEDEWAATPLGAAARRMPEDEDPFEDAEGDETKRRRTRKKKADADDAAAIDGQTAH